MSALRAVAVAFLAVLWALPAASSADDTSGASDDSFYFSSTERTVERREKGTKGQPSHEPSKPAFVLGRSGCNAADQVTDAALDGPSDVTFCQQYAEPTTPVLTVGLIRSAFAELKLPAGTLVIQPPDGLTLVNFDTNFYTTSTEPIARTVTLLGRRVTLEATPSTFHWTFGDGERLSTSDPGAPYPALRVTHNYLRKGTYRPALATTYTGRYRVGAGPWRQIPGTVTIDGTGQALRAIEAQPKLVSY